MKISSQTVALNYSRSPSIGCTFNTRSQAAASVSGCQLDVDNERAADITGLSRDTTEEGQGHRRVLTNNEQLSAAEIIDSSTSPATGLTSPFPQRKAASSDEQKYLATSPNISLKLSPNLLSHDELLSFEALTACRQRPLSSKQTPSSELRSF